MNETYWYHGRQFPVLKVRWKGYGLRPGKYHVRRERLGRVTGVLTDRDGWTRNNWSIVACFDTAQQAADYAHKLNSRHFIQVLYNVGH